MADSKKENSSANFADDLDAILNKAEETEVQEGSLDDKEVIDRLLIEEPNEEDQQISSSSEDSAANEITINDDYDEFADEDEFNVDDLISSVDQQANDEFSEGDSEEPINDIVSDDTLPDAKAVPDNQLNMDSASEPEANIPDAMTTFDISVDDDAMYELDEEEDALSDNELGHSLDKSQTGQVNIDKIESVAADLQIKLDTQTEVTEKTTQDVTQANLMIDELNTKVNQLLTDNEGLSELVAVLTSATTAKNALAEDEIDSLQKEHRKLRKDLKATEGKTPVMTYIVMVIAASALLIGGILGAMGYGVKADVENLTELVSTLEEEVEIVSAKNSGLDNQEVNFKINALQLKDQGFVEQLSEVNNKIQQPNTLKTVVDDLIVQNNHAQKAIEKLLASVEVLEGQKKVSRTKRKAKKPVVKAKWVVNLVSFKQEWYAKRKAEEFEKKGIPAKVEQVKIKGKQWFRLRVKGFKSKYEAAAYAVKVKKTLNLSSVWVTK